MLAIERADRSKIVPDQASWFPTLFEGINTARGRRAGGARCPRATRPSSPPWPGQELAELGYPVPTPNACARPPRAASSSTGATTS